MSESPFLTGVTAQKTGGVNGIYKTTGVLGQIGNIVNSR
jgi:hypothetical protein